MILREGAQCCNYASFESGNWYGPRLPFTTSNDIVNTLHHSALAALNKTNKHLTALACLAIGSTPAEYATNMAAEVKAAAASYLRLGLKPN